MPGTDGLALLAQIKALRPDTPTLLITGHGEHDLAVQALRGGAYDFIQKPIDREYFVASLIRAMQARQYKRQLDDQQHTLERHASDLERTIQERTRELQFLADASRILTASLDSEATLKSIARLAVPRLAERRWRSITPGCTSRSGASPKRCSAACCRNAFRRFPASPPPPGIWRRARRRWAATGTISSCCRVARSGWSWVTSPGGGCAWPP